VDLTLVLQGLVNGLLFGGVYSLMAVGLTLIFGVMRVVNFAHGDMMVWGMYLAYLLAARAGIDPYLGFVLCAAALFVLGLGVQRGLVDRIIAAPHEMQILLMLGVALSSRTSRCWRSARSRRASGRRSAAPRCGSGPSSWTSPAS
jgi:branched-chain amino acid transport system permease protein